MGTKTAAESVQDPMGSSAARVIAITSGKGGVGKTNVTGNLAIALARQGKRVCIFDADTSLANINVILGVTPRYTIEHLLNGERSIDEILLDGPEGVRIIPAASGIAALAELGSAERARLIAALEHLESRFDYLLIDTAAGIGDSVLSFIQSAQHTILVISTEPTSLTDAFALLRVLRRRGHDRPAYVLVNMALNYANSMEVYKRFEAAVRKYLSMKVHYLGYITDDKAIRASVSRQRPVLLNEPDALASRCFTTLAAVLSKQFAGTPGAHSFSAYWSELAPEPGAAPPPDSNAEAAVPAETPPRPAPSPEREDLGALAERTRAALEDPDVTLDRFERFCEPLLELFVARFHRLPLAQPDRIARLLGRTDHPEEEVRAWSEALARYSEGRFGRRPSAEEERAAAAVRERQEGLLAEYRAIVERLQSEQATLHNTLTRLYETINSELGQTAPRGARRGERSRDDEPGSAVSD